MKNTLKNSLSLWLKTAALAILLVLGLVPTSVRAVTQVIGWGGNDEWRWNLPPDLTNMVAIAAGESHFLALRDDGTVAAWGVTLTARCACLRA